MGVQAVLSGGHYGFIAQECVGAFELFGRFPPCQLLFWIKIALGRIIQLFFDNPVFVNGGLYVDIGWILHFNLICL